MRNNSLFVIFICSFTIQLTAQQFNNKDYKITWLVQNNKFSLVDVRTKYVIVPPIYDEAHLYSKDISVVRMGNNYGFVNSSGEKLTELQYEGAWNYNKKLILVKQSGKYKFLEKEALIDGILGFGGGDNDVEYDQVIFSHGEEFAIVMLGDKFGYINEEGQEVIPLVFENATFFENNVASVKLDGKWGVIDRDGNQIIGFKYNYLGTFNNGITVAKKGKRWGVIDHKEQVVLSFKYKYLTHFNLSDVALAKKGRYWGVINSKGDVLAPFEYQFDVNFEPLIDLNDDYIWIQKDGKWGTLDLNGQVTIPFEYDLIHTFDGDEARVWKKNQLVLIDMAGNCLENCGEAFLGLKK